MSTVAMPTAEARERLAGEVREAQGVLSAFSAGFVDVDATRRVDQRWQAYKAVRSLVRQIASDEEWRDNPIAQELLDQTLELEERLEADGDGTDPQWRVKEVADHIADLVATLMRETEHNALDEPTVAAQFVLQHLPGIDQEELGELFGVDARTVRERKAGTTKTIRKDPERVVLVAQLVYDLRRAMTPRGVVSWFRRSRPQLDGRAPLEVIDHEDIDTAADLLRPLARGARGQLGA
jgi:hypothetical protein